MNAVLPEPPAAESPSADQLAGLLDGELSEAEQQALRETLEADPAARQRYLDYLELHALLHWQQSATFPGLDPERFAAGKLPDVADSDDHQPPRAGRAARAVQAVWTRVHRVEPVSMILSGLFLAIVLLSLGLVRLPGIEHRQEPPVLSARDFVARVAGTHDARWSELSGLDGEPPLDLVGGRRVELLEGLAEVRFDAGTTVLLEAPATLIPLGRNELRLESGSLTARVPRQATGFTVRTFRAAFIDLGTEFSVVVEPEGTAAAAVHEGRIAVEPHGGGQRRILTAGQSLSFGTDGPARAMPAPAVDRFVRALPRPAPPLPRPVARWTFENDSLLDEVFGIAAVPHGQAAVADGRLHLPDGESWLLLPDAPDYTPFLGKSYSVVLWIRPAEVAAANVVVRTSRDGPFTHFSHQLSIGGDGRPTHYTHDGHRRWVTGESPLSAGQWQQVAIVGRRGAGMALYVDGSLAAEWAGPLENLWALGDRFHLGGPSMSIEAEPTPGFVGEVEQVTLYARALSAEEIGRLRAASEPAPSTTFHSEGE